MESTSIDRCTTDAVIRLANIGAQSETNSHSDCFVVEAESTCWDRHRVKPIATMGGCGGQETGSVVLTSRVVVWLISDSKTGPTTTESNTFWLPTGGHHQREGLIVTASDLIQHSSLYRLPGYSGEFVPGGCEYQQQTLRKPLMLAWTRFEPPDLLTTPEGWPVSTGHLYKRRIANLCDNWAHQVVKLG